MSLISKLLNRNTSPARIAGFAISNFIGILIIAAGVMIYCDSRSLWSEEDSFVNTDYMVINKKVTSANTVNGSALSQFSEEEISDLSSQPWVRRVGEFSSSPFRVYASVASGGRGMETALFFESVPDSFVDVPAADWQFRPEEGVVPVVIPKEYLTLYNFGFAGSAGMPQMSESILKGVPLSLYMRSEDGSRMLRMEGRIAGFSRRLNTVLVPQSFMDYAISKLSPGEVSLPARLIVDVSSPGDVAISDYLKEHSLEVAGEKDSNSAAFLLRLAIGIAIGIGIVITVLSLFVLMLSISLLMEKNRQVIHRLLMLGAPLSKVRAPYVRLIWIAGIGAWAGAISVLAILRSYYSAGLQAVGGGTSGIFVAILAATLLTGIVVAANVISASRKVRGAWGLRPHVS